MEKGALVEFLVKGVKRLGIVDGPEGKHLFRVVDAFGNTLHVHPRDVAFDSSSVSLDDRKTPLAPNLNSWLERASTVRGEIDLETVWELLRDESRSDWNLRALADCLWDSLTVERAWALNAALSEDKIYFKSKGESWEIRSADQVEALKKQATASAQKAIAQNETLERFEEYLRTRTPVSYAGDVRRVEALKRLVLDFEEAADKNAAFELLTLLKRPKTDVAAFALLQELGVWSKHENLDVQRVGLKKEFEDRLLEEARVLAANPGPDVPRVDLTHHEVVTIDDESTTEIDDGLSIETSGEKTLFWVHIADPSRWVEESSALGIEARRRGTTVYLPTERYTMFPLELAEGPFSLVEGRVTACVSFGCELGLDGSLVSAKIVCSTVKTRRRLSYLDARTLVESEDPLLSRLAQAAELRARWRQSQGAVTIRLPESRVKVDLEADTVAVDVYRDDSARELVAEFMILAGEACARFFVERGVPTLFRGQTAPDRELDVSAIPEGLPREWAKITTMSRSVFSTEPIAHYGLGLSAYVQATSPIRRYSDLFVHYQIKSMLFPDAERLAVDEEKERVAIVASELDPLNAQAAKLERNADKYWTLEYLNRHKSQTWTAIVLGWFREDDRQAHVVIEELGFRTIVKLSKTRALGASIRLKVAAVDARKDLLTWTEAS